MNINIPDEIFDQLKMVVAPMITVARDGSFKQIGTTFVVGQSEKQALLFTAAHNLKDVEDIDNEKNYMDTNKSCFFEQKPLDNLRNTKIFTLFWDKHKNFHMLPVIRAWWSEPVDIACIYVEVPNDYQNEFNFEYKLALDSRPPEKGESVIAIGYSNMEAFKTDIDYDTGIAFYGFQQKLTWRDGTVLEVFPQQVSPLIKWPCFRTDIPIDSGMSGGIIFRKTSLPTPHVCGVLTYDSSEGNSNKIGSGNFSIATQLWPAVNIKIQVQLCGDSDEDIKELKGLFERGIIEDIGQAHKRVIKHKKEDGTEALTWNQYNINLE